MKFRSTEIHHYDSWVVVLQDGGDYVMTAPTENGLYGWPADVARIRNNKHELCRLEGSKTLLY